MKHKILGLTGLVAMALLMSFAPIAPSNSIALLKYNGGGDWYANPTSLPNLAAFCNKNLDLNINTDPPTVEVGRPWQCGFFD